MPVRLQSWWILIGLLFLGLEAQAQDLWLMKAHDARRTGQSLSNGPLTLDAAQSWTAETPGAHTLNIGATVTARGVFFGSWGLLRQDPTNPDRRFWDKSDGKLYGLDLDTGASLWGEPLGLDLTPRCYERATRQKTNDDVFWCGALNPLHVSFYNGTVEGQAAVDTSRKVLYLGRGDGKLFAIDPEDGRILWRFVTFNPQLPDDPDGGGEVISSPLLGPDGTVYFGTWGEGPYETHAFYAVDPDSTLQWRYPTDSSLTHRIFASPALSPDAGTIYVSTFRDDDGVLPPTLYAFHREPAGPATDEARLKWALDLTHQGLPVQTTTLAVGSDGTIYVGGLWAFGLGIPVLLAVEDRGEDGPALKWTTPYLELRDGAQFVLGIALREVDGQTRRLYVTTANTSLFNAKEEGALYAVDPASGAVLASYDPSDDVPEAIGGINSPAIGADGTVYFGVRGRFGNDAVNGHYFAVTYDAAAARFDQLWNFEVDGHIEWNHPAIGPDGGLYGGSSSVDQGVRLVTHDAGTIPPNTTPLFYALKGPANPVAVDEAAPVPAAFQLYPAYPNPFTATTALSVALARPGHLRVHVVDLLGRTVRTLADARKPAGRYRLVWDGADGAGRRLAGGIYFARLLAIDEGTGQAYTAVRKLVLMR